MKVLELSSIWWPTQDLELLNIQGHMGVYNILTSFLTSVQTSAILPRIPSTQCLNILPKVPPCLIIPRFPDANNPIPKGAASHLRYQKTNLKSAIDLVNQNDFKLFAKKVFPITSSSPVNHAHTKDQLTK